MRRRLSELQGRRRASFGDGDLPASRDVEDAVLEFGERFHGICSSRESGQYDGVDCSAGMDVDAVVESGQQSHIRRAFRSNRNNCKRLTSVNILILS